jgi:hypothetical protein
MRYYSVPADFKKETIDCFIIGHNEPDPATHINRIREMGVHSGTYRDLNLGFIQKDSRFYHAADFFNFLFCNDDSAGSGLKPLRLGETFSATIAYLGTYLHRRGLTFDFVNSFNEEKEELARRLTRENILTIAISCPYSCAFCGFPQHAGPYQTAGVDAIEKELNGLQELGTVKLVHFIDDTFNVPTQRFKNLLRMLLRNRYSFKWISNLRCQFTDREMIELMKESGCEGVFLGIESGNNQILENMNKAASIEKYLEGIAVLKEFEIVTYGSFIIGFPGETQETVQDTIGFIEDSGLDFYRAQLWYYEPITPIDKDREKYQLKGTGFEWGHATMDAKKASSLIEEMFLSIHKAIWVPQYNFDFNNMFHLTHRGISRNEVRNYLKAFNRGVWEKLMDPTHTGVSHETIALAKRSITRIGHYQTNDVTPVDAANDTNRQGHDFDMDSQIDIDFNLN